MPVNHLSEILESLVPTTQEELSGLRFVLYCAQLIQKGTPLDTITLESRDSLVLTDNRTPGVGLDLPGFLRSLSEDSKKYFHGLVEAVEIYQAIYGQILSPQTLTLSDKAVYELKQIRDMCLEDGLRSIY